MQIKFPFFIRSTFKQKIQITFFFVLLLFSAVAQEKKDSAVIDIRHRFVPSGDNDHFAGEEVDSFRTLHLAIAGNVYQTEQHLAYAFNKQTGKYDFKNELKYVQPILGLGDITIANL